MCFLNYCIILCQLALLNLQSDIGSQSSDKPANLLRIWRDQSRCKSGQAGKLDLILLNWESILYKCLKFHYFLLYVVLRDEPILKLFDKGLPCLVVFSGVVSTLDGLPPSLCCPTKHMCCQLNSLLTCAFEHFEDLLNLHCPFICLCGILYPIEFWGKSLHELFN